MAISNFISTVWSENLYRELDKKFVAVANCNHDWEGEIRQKGDRVKILGVGPVSVFNYTKNTDMTVPAALSDSVRELVIDQAKAFNFQIDDVDRAQANPKIMTEALRNAAAALANQADAHVLSLYSSIAAKNQLKVDATTSDNIIDKILEGMLILRKNGVTDDIVLEVSPAIGSLLLKAKLNLATDNTATLENGCIGSIAGCRVFVSGNVCTATPSGSGSATYHKCMMHTRRAIAFAEQLSEIEAYRPELRFADAVKGLMLYGAKIVYGDEIILLDLGIAN
ncbi:MAG: P22 coat protein - protein 5 domain protein [Clostridia bacterium]|nr:P22 coat protein - protein 5 domain protein [Clostridia bacterium]